MKYTCTLEEIHIFNFLLIRTFISQKRSIGHKKETFLTETLSPSPTFTKNVFPSKILVDLYGSSNHAWLVFVISAFPTHKSLDFQKMNLPGVTFIFFLVSSGPFSTLTHRALQHLRPFLLCIPELIKKNI